MIPLGIRGWMAVLWPGFVAGGLIEMLVFSWFEPEGVLIFGLDLGRNGTYTAAFIGFWVVCTLGCIGTWNLLRSPEELNAAQPASRHPGTHPDPAPAVSAQSATAAPAATRQPRVPKSRPPVPSTRAVPAPTVAAPAPGRSRRRRSGR